MSSSCQLSTYDGPTNMARDRALLDAAEMDGKVGWRVYGWDGPWISLGMNQDPETDLLPTNPVPWVKRPTGGRAVLHGHDVTVAIAAPLSAIWGKADGQEPAARSRSVRGAYRWVTRPIIEALSACGLPCDLAENVAGTVRAEPALGDITQPTLGCGAPADVADGDGRLATLGVESVQPETSIPRPSRHVGTRQLPRPGQEEGEFPGTSIQQPRSVIPFPLSDVRDPQSSIHNPQSKIQNPRSADCFAGVSRNDIVDLKTGLKACGCAFRMTKRAVLLQASIPAGAPLVDPAIVYADPSMIVAPQWEDERFAAEFATVMGRIRLAT